MQMDSNSFLRPSIDFNAFCSLFSCNRPGSRPLVLRSNWPDNYLIFTPVCQSFCSRGGLCPSMHHRSHDQGGLCPGRVSVWESLSRGVSVQGVSVQEGLCPGGLCPWRSLSGGLCPGRSLLGGSLSRKVSAQGVSVWGVLCQGDPRTVMCGRYASYWNAYLLQIKFNFWCCNTWKKT